MDRSTIKKGGRDPSMSAMYQDDDGTGRSLMGLVSDAGLRPMQQWSALQSLQSGSMYSRAAVEDSTMGALKASGLKVGYARRILEASKRQPKNTPIHCGTSLSEGSAQPNTAVSWSRPLQCIGSDSPKTSHHLLSKDFRQYTTYTDRTKNSPMCFAPPNARCFRAFVDHFASPAETKAVADAFRCKCRPGEEKCSEDHCPTDRKQHAEHPVVRAWEARIRTVLESEFNIPLRSVHLHNVRTLYNNFSSINQRWRIEYGCVRWVSTTAKCGIVRLNAQGRWPLR